MNFETYNKHVNSLNFGKQLPEAIYIHINSICKISSELSAFVSRVSSALKISTDNWNIIKLSKKDFRLSLLHYPDFDNYPYPALHTSYTIDLTKLTLRKADYSTAHNPPILHRREAFLHPDEQQVPFYKSFTEEGERIGLYVNTRSIGLKNHWQKLIAKHGYTLDDEGHLFLQQSHMPETSTEPGKFIARHKTALSRNKLSTPMYHLATRGYLNGEYSLLDYGCGRGDDIRELEANGINSVGWDPVFSPDVELECSDIVNLGFVINVIEDQTERCETLKRAFGFAEKLLVVSAMLGTERIYQKFKSFKDGVITSRNTFQKYYQQAELKNYIESVLSNNAIAAGPGIFLVFKDKIEEQKYLLEKQRTSQAWRQISKTRERIINERAYVEIHDKYSELLDSFWFACLDFGRTPSFEEFDQSEQLVSAVGSLKKAIYICIKKYSEEDLNFSRKRRIDDLLVYFSLEFFSRRKPYSRMPESLKKDIKSFFGSYSRARDMGEKLLFSISSIDEIYKACKDASSAIPKAILNGQHDLIFHRSYFNQLPTILRVYVGCAIQLYGEIDNVDLIKIHIASGKVSLMIYDNFDDSPIPLLRERIKIKLREQDIDFFDYVGEFQPQPLYNKSLYIDENFHDYSDQIEFDKQLEKIGIKTYGEKGPSAESLKTQLRSLGYLLDGYRICKA
jgi:DNA phosphorothioation-associated putative methyltransferase